MTLRVKILNKSGNELPSYVTPGSAGIDLRADLEHPLMLEPGERKLIPTGIYVVIPDGFEGQIRSRSGLSVRNGVVVLNAPGTIDSDYRGEVRVCLINMGRYPFVIENDMRIAQMVVSKVEHVEFEQVNSIDSDTERGDGGFGHTGVK